MPIIQIVLFDICSHATCNMEHVTTLSIFMLHVMCYMLHEFYFSISLNCLLLLYSLLLKILYHTLYLIYPRENWRIFRDISYSPTVVER